MSEMVVLVNEKNVPIGTAEKLATHNAETPLHRGFSVFLFNEKGELLIQQRSRKKKTWPLVWSNSCCGHPMLGEKPENAAKRRLAFELGVTDAEVTMILPKYRYRFEHRRVVENEICPVMVASSHQTPKPNPDEVEAIRWISWENWLKEVSQNSENYSEWCVEETILLERSRKFKHIFHRR